MGMTTKAYLGQIERLDRMIQNKLQEIYQLRTMMCGTTANSDSERVQTSSDKDKLGVMVAKIVDMENEANEMIDKRCLIVNQIDNMSDTDKYDILAKHYILGKDLKVIAIDNKMSIRHIIRLHGNAVKEFEEKYGKEYL